MNSWCGEHRPDGHDACPVHFLRWGELHDEELKEKYQLEAVFYCPVLSCDKMTFTRGRPNFGNFSDWNGLATKRAMNLIWEIFMNTARMKVFLHKLAHRENDGK